MLQQCCLSSLQPESYLPDLVHFPWPVEYNSPLAGSVWALGLIFPWQTPGKHSWWGAFKAWTPSSGRGACR